MQPVSRRSISAGVVCVGALAMIATSPGASGLAHEAPRPARGGHAGRPVQESFRCGPFSFGPAQEIFEDVEFHRPMGLWVAPDGAVVVVDLGSNSLTKFSEEGEILWTTGREGEGPGEFRTLYRVAVGDDGTIVAYDFFGQRLSWFDSTGSYVDQTVVEFPILAHDLVLLDDGSVLLAGFARGKPHSIHRVDDQGAHLGSFGPLPSVRDPETLQYWPTGSIELTADDTVLFSVRIPYEIHEFFPDGRSRTSWEGPYEFDRAPEEAFDQTRSSDGRTSISISPVFVPYPSSAYDLGDGYVLGQVQTEEETRIWDLFLRGEHVTRCEHPSVRAVAGLDRTRGYLYVSGETADGNNTYYRIPYGYAMEQPRRDR